jgi:hypothetical protein
VGLHGTTPSAILFLKVVVVGTSDVVAVAAGGSLSWVTDVEALDLRLCGTDRGVLSP